jgi:hypothetical protein
LGYNTDSADVSEQRFTPTLWVEEEAKQNTSVKVDDAVAYFNPEDGGDMFLRTVG